VASRARAKPAPKPSPEELLRASKEPDFRQERSRRSYLALLDAATELFSTRPFDSVGTPDIAQHAGVSVGLFYRYFDDKQAIYLEVVRRTMTAAYDETLAKLTPERFAGRARHETIQEAVAVLFAHVLAHPQLSRSVLEMSLRDPQVAELRGAFETAGVQRLTALIAAIVPRAVIADPEATAYVLYGSAMQTVFGVVAGEPPCPVDATRARAALATVIERTLFPTR